MGKASYIAKTASRFGNSSIGQMGILSVGAGVATGTTNNFINAHVIEKKKRAATNKTVIVNNGAAASGYYTRKLANGSTVKVTKSQYHGVGRNQSQRRS